MLFVENFNTDPYVNHALEEWLMDNYSDDCFMLWRNDKAILLGRNQNAYSEINLPYTEERGIKIVRRITGGGAVFTDGGNIMFTFISGKGRGDFADFRKFTEPVVAAINFLGIPAEFTGRNDLVIGGAKFSGNAQCIYKDKLLHHGTLMYNANTTELSQALNVSRVKLKSKGVTSVSSRVTNISAHMDKPMDIEDFRAYLFKYVMENTENPLFIRLTNEEWEQVREKALEKHATHEWIFGRSPEFNIKREEKLPGGLVQVYLQVEAGKIERVHIFGDFFGGGVEAAENALIGAAYERNGVEKALSSLGTDFMGNIPLEDLIKVIIQPE